MNELRCKRIYETPVETDGFRILVDKLWPRGMKKENAKIDLWRVHIQTFGYRKGRQAVQKTCKENHMQDDPR